VEKREREERERRLGTPERLYNMMFCEVVKRLLYSYTSSNSPFFLAVFLSVFLFAFLSFVFSTHLGQGLQLTYVVIVELCYQWYI